MGWMDVRMPSGHIHGRSRFDRTLCGRKVPTSAPRLLYDCDMTCRACLNIVYVDHGTPLEKRSGTDGL